MDADAVVLDIDGVLIDVSQSYRRAIVDTVDRCYNQTIKRTDIQEFKNAGGFNNDWDVTNAVALYILTTRHESVSVDQFTTQIAAHGGGLESALTVVDNYLSTADYEMVLDAWNSDRLRDMFQALYLGSERYRELEDGEPPIDTQGYIIDEPVIIETETVDLLRKTTKIGILTGRPAAEASIALDRVQFSIPSSHQFTMDDWEEGKPHPRALQMLADRLEANTIVFVGDTLDDIKTAVNANMADSSRTYHGVGALTGGLSGDAGRDAFMSVGAHTVIDSVNDISDLVQ